MSSAKIKTSFTYRVRQRTLTFFENLLYEDGAYSSHVTGIIGSIRLCSVSCNGAVEPSTPSVRCGDVFKYGESVIVTQRKFRLHLMFRFTGGSRHETRYFFGFTTFVPRLLQRRNMVCLNERWELRKVWRPCEMLLTRARVDLQYAMPKLRGCLTLLFGEFYTKIWTSTHTNYWLSRSWINKILAGE